MALNTHEARVETIYRLAKRDHDVEQAVGFRYCALCNNGDEEYAELYSAERRRLMEEK